MELLARRRKRLLGVPADIRLEAWANAEFGFHELPTRPFRGAHRMPASIGLAGDRLWLSKAGASHDVPIEDIVMLSVERRPRGAVRVEFMEGEPLVVLAADGGRLLSMLGAALARYDRQLQMGAQVALGVPAPSPDLAARIDTVRQRAEDLRRLGGDDRFVRLVADGYADEEGRLLHEAQVDALRDLRRALLATQWAPVESER